MKNLFKFIVSFIVITSSYSNAVAQELSPEETKKLAKEAKELDFQATELMINFIVTQNVESFNKGAELWKKALENYGQVMAKGTAASGNETLDMLSATTYDGAKALVQANVNIYDNGFKDKVMKETPADRKKSVTFKGQSYLISKANKDKFEYLESNWSADAALRK